MTFIDTHAHMEMSEYDNDRDEMVNRAINNGIEKIITIGIGKEECQAAIELAQRYPCVFAALGVHPHNAKVRDKQIFNFIKDCTQHQKVVALGEMGLDYYRNLSPKKEQVRCFHEQLSLAKELKLPVIIHSREAYQETLRILRQEKAWEVGGVMHCFSGDTKMAFACLDMGFYISIAGTITFKNATILREVVGEIPLEKIVIETDAPFLAPHPFRGKRNEPANVKLIAEKISQIKNVPLREVAQSTTNNAKTLFSLP
jgi:TatD DNase family protein